MPDDATTPVKARGNQGVQQDDNQTNLTIPADIQAKFADLIELIKVSRSMNNEERQYWIDVLPIMSADQIQNLRNILDNEKKQIDAAEAAYSQGVQSAAKTAAKEFDEVTYRAKKQARVEAERRQEAEEKEHEEAILAELNRL